MRNYLCHYLALNAMTTTLFYILSLTNYCFEKIKQIKNTKITANDKLSTWF